MRWKDGTIVTATTYSASSEADCECPLYVASNIEREEEKIKASGYPRAISGEDVYNDICDQIDGKENGTYLLLSKFEEDVVFEYHITIQDEDFNLGILTMRTPEGVFEADFDA